MDDYLANELVKYLWLDVLRDNMEHPDSIITLSQYKKLISANEKVFVYEFSLDDKGRLNGDVWKKSTMRDNYKIYGG